MPVAWFVAPYKRRDRTIGIGIVRPGRYCAIDDYSAAIAADGGAWREVEILGQRAIVKVRASVTTLQTINADSTIRGFPASRLDDSLSTFTNAQRTALRNLALDCGYNSGEWGAAFPNVSQATLGQFFRFLATRRRKVRLLNGQIVDDGPVQATESVDALDALIGDAI